MGLAFAAFVAGLFTFLAPCTLPLVPGYIGFISGSSVDDLKDLKRSKKARRNIFINGLFFTIGFSLVFVAFGALAGAFGASLAAYRIWLTKIGGVFVIVFGLLMMDILKIPFLARTHQIKAPKIFERGKPHNSLILGSAFGLGWTPCVGPVLGSILALAATSTTVFQGAFLLLIFSSGLAVPFLLVAIGYGSATEHIKAITKYLRPISFIGGIFLVVIGILLITNNFALLISYGFRILKFIGLGSFEELLFNYL